MISVASHKEISYKSIFFFFIKQIKSNVSASSEKYGRIIWYDDKDMVIGEDVRSAVQKLASITSSPLHETGDKIYR